MGRSVVRAGTVALMVAGTLWQPSLGASAQEAPRPEGGADLPPPAFRVVGRSFLAIRVPDAEEAAEWYRSALQLGEVKHLEAEDGRYSVRILSGSGLTVELIRVRGDAPAPSQPQLGLFKSGFFVDDIDAALEWLRGQGADTDDSIFIDDALNARSFVFRDPYGNRLQAFQDCGGECEGQERSSAPVPQVVSHLSGSWEGTGVLLDRTAGFEMRWEVGERGFVRLSFANAWIAPNGDRTPVLSAEATYLFRDSTGVGVWVDNRPQQLTLAVEATDTSLVTQWVAPSEEGRTEYIVQGDSVLVRDFVGAAGSERLFAEAVYTRSRSGG